MVRRIGIIGAGAIGCVVGGLLTKAGRDVTLIDQWPEHVDAMKARGLRLSGTCGEHTIRVNALHVHEAQRVAEPFDAVFIAVKSYDTEWATALGLAYLRRPDGVVVDFQNGINDERVAAMAGRERTLGCVITIGAGMYEPGHAMRTDQGAVGFKIGELDGADSTRARELVALLNDVAPSKVTPNLRGERWSKLAVNCMANALAGLSGLGSAEVRSEPGPRRLAIHLAAEAILVGRACGHEVEPIYGIDAQRFVEAAGGRGLAEVERDMAASAKFLSGGRPSLLQDVLRGRRTEIDHLNGYVAAQGRRVGVSTPFNDAVVAAVRGHGVGTLKPDVRNLEPLLGLLPRESGGRPLLGDVVELSIVVRDLDAAVERFTRLFGLTVHRRDESQAFGFRNAILPTGIGHIELMEPTDPAKPVGRFLEKHGEGVYLVGFEVDDIPGGVARLRAQGVRVDDRRPDIAWVHPSETHGVFVELRKRESYGT
jgi:2-dehydropantoate 2-reductase